MVVKVKESFEKTRLGKNIDNSKKYILRGQRNVRYFEKFFYPKKNLISFLKRTISFSFVRARTFDRARTLPEHLIGILFGKGKKT